MSGGDNDSAKLRVLLVTEDDPLYVIRFFEVFFAECPERIELCGITVDDAFHEPLTKTAKRMLGFYGPLGFVRLGTRFAAVKARRVSIARLAERHGIEVVHTTSVNDPAYVQRVRDMNVDVIVSVAAPEIFRQDILGAARLGCINIHSGRLPKYRGMMPTFWQLLHGEDHVTITVHEMVEQLDAGRILGTRRFELRDHDVLDRVITETKRDGARLMIDVLQQMADGTTSPQDIDMTQKEYFSFPKGEDVRKFRKRGHRLL